MAQPLQIIATGDSTEDRFVLNEENLKSIIDKIPEGMKVSVVAVVGAFRTGKSFLLSLFLRYLRNSTEADLSQTWMTSEGTVLVEGNMNEGDWSMVDSEKMSTSFPWRGGQQRQTTGIWMWSEPFIRTTKSSKGEKIAILLMDTQGMFDNETTMTLTAQIFGLSTLVSSFQIYNVDKRIQEDNLQHLALFSEYGRMALLPQSEQEKKKELLDKAIKPELPPLPVQPVAAENATPAAESTTSTEGTSTEATPAAAPAAPVEEASPPPPRGLLFKSKSVWAHKPFQRLQFLVRDWQNFDNEFDEDVSFETLQQARDDMQKYVQEVLRTRLSLDLQSTREQITSCFETLDCFLLPHPGSAVTKKNYDGSIAKIDEQFRILLNFYVRYIFDEELEAKHINGREITGIELKTYFEVYVKMFQTGESTFPKAMTMLDATAEANNRNAYDLAMAMYKKMMNSLVGAEKTQFVKEGELTTLHEQLLLDAQDLFDSIATMGSPTVIEKAREQLLQHISEEKEKFFSMNALRNPMKDIDFYILPIGIAIVSWFFSVLVDKTCSSNFCENVEDTFENIYLYILFIGVILMWRHISSVMHYAREFLLPILQGQLNKQLGK